MQKAIDFLLEYPKTILFFVIGLSAIFASFLNEPGLKVDNSTENIFPVGNPEVEYFYKFRQKFGSDEFLVVVFHNQGRSVFEPLFLEYLSKLTDRFQEIRFKNYSVIENVLALTTTKKPDFHLDQESVERILSSFEPEELYRLYLHEIPPVQREEISRDLLGFFLKRSVMDIRQNLAGIVMKNLTKKQAKEISLRSQQHLLFYGKYPGQKTLLKWVYPMLSFSQKEAILQALLRKYARKQGQVLFRLFREVLSRREYEAYIDGLVKLFVRGEREPSEKELFEATIGGLSSRKREVFLRKVLFQYPYRQSVFKKILVRLRPLQKETILKKLLLRVEDSQFQVQIVDIFRHLFTLPLRFEKGLRVGQLSPSLREEFAKHRLPLSEGARLEFSSSFWRVVDGGARYVLKKENRFLNVYSEGYLERYIQKAKAILLKIPPMRGMLLPRVGEDKTAVILQVRRPPEDPEKALAVIVEKVRRLLAEYPPPHELKVRHYIAGSPAIKADILRAIRMDVAIFVPITVLIIVGIVYALFRTWGAVLLPLLVIFLTDIWVLGWMAYLGYPLNTLTSLIISLMFVIGVADVVHLMAKYFDEYERTGEKKESLRHMLEQLILPCWLTSFTTMVGFASLVISDIEPIRHFGLFAALGVGIALLLSIVLVSSILMIFPIVRREVSSKKAGLNAVLRLFYRCSLYKKTVVLGALGILLFFGWGMFKMSAETNFLEFFKESSRIRQANRFVEEHFAGIAPIEVVFEVKKGSVHDYRNLKRIEEFQEYIKSKMPYSVYIDQATSVVDFYKFANMIRLPDLEELMAPEEFQIGASLLDQKRYTLPDPKSLSLNYRLLQKALRMYEKAYGEAEVGVRKFVAKSLEVQDISNEDWNSPSGWKIARISVRGKAVGSRIAAKVIEQMRRYAREHYKDANIHITGTGALFPTAADSIVEGQKKSFLMAILIIFITMVVVFRSFRTGILGLIPNVFPIVTTFGAMGWLGIPLNSSTSMVASISIGIAVDVAIHFISRFRLEIGAAGCVKDAIRSTFRITGRPILFTSAILMAGFLVLCLGSFVPTIQFGVLTCITIFSALVSGLVLLPAVMLLLGFRPRRRDGQEAPQGVSADEQEGR
ncbi:MAG: hypothetical protein D6805_01350 [Planctomycetota bacterium]|nr:MAG: hypothetical protein D6805_01350 [Planctomycetota bacterium]